jgi:hypothetical protein
VHVIAQSRDAQRLLLFSAITRLEVVRNCRADEEVTVSVVVLSTRCSSDSHCINLVPPSESQVRCDGSVPNNLKVVKVMDEVRIQSHEQE